MSEPRDDTLVSTGGDWSLHGPLTIDTAARVFAVSAEADLPPTGVVALGHVQGVDSAGVALLLAWKRRAVVEGKPLAFAGIPPNLAALAALYGVEDLLAAADEVRPPAAKA